MRFSLRLGLVVAAVALSWPGGVARAQDHEKCYKIKDPVKLLGFLDLTTPQFGLEPGCKVGRARYFCAPASKTVISAVDKAPDPDVPIIPLPLFAPPAPVDRICYKVKCPIPPPPFPPDQLVTDQFGTRILTTFKAAYICTPAVKGPSFCGDGVIDPGEACDAPALGACTVGCEADCTCTCPTACCYVEDLAFPPETECFEYSGTPAQVGAFMASCTLGGPPIGSPGSLPAGSMANSAVPAPCGASPIFGFPCVLGPPGFGNLHTLPADSSCP